MLVRVLRWNGILNALSKANSDIGDKMALIFNQTSIDGVILIGTNVLSDERGSFTKCFEAAEFHDHGLSVKFAEEYFSFSKAGVLRGMHFQLPPLDHEKVVYCALGRVLDVVLDLRPNSATYKQCLSIELSSKGGEGLYIPKGCAHGFWSLEDSIMVYKVGTPYSPEHDTGICWDSFGFNWPGDQPVLSSRDSMHICLEDFRSPF
jgi:dTDP-4-dehydrorhamnose 3,5-epimerase